MSEKKPIAWLTCPTNPNVSYAVMSYNKATKEMELRGKLTTIRRVMDKEAMTKAGYVLTLEDPDHAKQPELRTRLHTGMEDRD